MPIAGPFYFAWVQPTETTFNSSHHRMDEYIFSARRTIAEGEKPLLEIQIQNPHVGILSTGRKYWAWFSWFNGSTIVPLFFGRVVGTPVQIFEEVITLQLVAHPQDYHQRRQLLAETLKVRPFYDQVFIDAGHRDDPDTILEGHAKVWDVNPVTHAVTANDIITGTSNVDFTEDDHFYDGMSMSVGQPPATAILMDASVSWSQTSTGIVDLGMKIVSSFSGDGIIGDWPKPLSSIGGGWTVYASDAVDLWGVNNAKSVSGSISYTNTQKRHHYGDTMSVNESWSHPTHGGMEYPLTEKWQTGLLDPNAKDEDGDPAPKNIPASHSRTWGVLCSWSVATSLVLQYVADRRRTERVIFQVRADVQPVLVDPTLAQETEVMTKSGANVGIPILDTLNWTTVAGKAVSIGQVIFPDNPKVPGGRSAQICVNGGTCGTVTPEFSDIVGVTTVDGGVIWSSIGAASPPENAVDWTARSNVPLGQIIRPKREFFISWEVLQKPGRIKYPSSGVSVSVGTIVDGGGPYFFSERSFQVCTRSGTTGLQSPIFSSVWGTVVDDGNAQWTSLGPTLPSGGSYFIATQGGQTGPSYLIPSFNETLHAVTLDGTVQWTCIGHGEIPMGGVVGEVRGPSYFTTDRGRESLEYLASLVRAKLLYRARCVQINFDCSYLRGYPLTTRQTVTLHDPRIAGGIALGKIKETVLSVSDSGTADCQVTLACCAGKGNAVDEVEGSPVYVAAGYVAHGYQDYDDHVVLVKGSTNLGYTKPRYVANDDGLSFPLTKEMVCVQDVVHGEGLQMMGMSIAADSAAYIANAPPAEAAYVPPPPVEPGTPIRPPLPQLGPPLPTGAGNYSTNLGGSGNQYEEASQKNFSNMLALNPVWIEYEIKPVNAGPFNKVYNVKFSTLKVPMGIDLRSGAIT